MAAWTGWTECEGERALLDYKTRSAASLRQKVKEEDDHQLAFYGLLAGGAMEHAHYVALELGPTRRPATPPPRF
jgi:ATP-dependent helicase/nuclease subunit B